MQAMDKALIKVGMPLQPSVRACNPRQARLSLWINVPCEKTAMLPNKGNVLIKVVKVDKIKIKGKAEATKAVVLLSRLKGSQRKIVLIRLIAPQRLLQAIN